MVAETDHGRVVLVLVAAAAAITVTIPARLLAAAFGGGQRFARLTLLAGLPILSGRAFLARLTLLTGLTLLAGRTILTLGAPGALTRRALAALLVLAPATAAATARLVLAEELGRLEAIDGDQRNLPLDETADG